MAKIVLRDCVITVDAVDLSDHVSSVTIETKFDEQEATGFGATYKEKLQGLGDANITLNFWQDFDASSVDATLWPISQAGDPVPVTVKPHDTTVAATNPLYTMQGILFNYSPLDGKVGDVSATQVTFGNGDQSGLVRTTS